MRLAAIAPSDYCIVDPAVVIDFRPQPNLLLGDDLPLPTFKVDVITTVNYIEEATCQTLLKWDSWVMS